MRTDSYFLLIVRLKYLVLRYSYDLSHDTIEISNQRHCPHKSIDFNPLNTIPMYHLQFASSNPEKTSVLALFRRIQFGESTVSSRRTTNFPRVRKIEPHLSKEESRSETWTSADRAVLRQERACTRLGHLCFECEKVFQFWSRGTFQRATTTPTRTPTRTRACTARVSAQLLVRASYDR